MSKKQNFNYYKENQSTITSKAWKRERLTQCKICGDTVDMLTYTHMKKHDITQREYCLMFPEHARPQFWACDPGLEADKKFEEIREEAERLNKKESE